MSGATPTAALTVERAVRWELETDAYATGSGRFPSMSDGGGKCRMNDQALTDVRESGAHREMDLTPAQRREQGVSLRKITPRSSHAEWAVRRDRPSPVAFLQAQDAQRLAWLVPYRHQRLAESPFAFFRGSATIMAADLAGSPTSGLQSQICGDAHLANFGLFASPERNLVFDINDFDETLCGPWEWDIKRLATSFVVAARHNGFDHRSLLEAVQASVRYYQRGMDRLASMPMIQVWHGHVRANEIGHFFAQERRLGESQRRELGSRQAKVIGKARAQDGYKALSKIARQVDGHFRFKSQPPQIVPISELIPENQPDQIRDAILSSFDQYRTSLPDARRFLLDRYRLRDLALKVVGVGSVGTRCFVVLFEGREAQDPLLLQVKEANSSVLEAHLPPSPYDHHGQRVVEGQRLMQMASDVFLGWSRGVLGPHYYWRRFRDMKLSAPLESYRPRQMTNYAMLCGLTLAQAHARTGDAAAIAGYIGTSDTFVRALTTFAEAYADQNERDHAEFLDALKSGAIASAETHQAQG